MYPNVSLYLPWAIKTKWLVIYKRMSSCNPQNWKSTQKVVSSPDHHIGPWTLNEANLIHQFCFLCSPRDCWKQAVWWVQEGFKAAQGVCLVWSHGSHCEGQAKPPSLVVPLHIQSPMARRTDRMMEPQLMQVWQKWDTSTLCFRQMACCEST